jgi:hypothetical protein
MLNDVELYKSIKVAANEPAMSARCICFGLFLANRVEPRVCFGTEELIENPELQR